ncbi:MAG: acetylxylan esterase [Bacteroidales bacterium]|nr:acetylxylan esterase [Bacteroidales bacterium]
MKKATILLLLISLSFLAISQNLPRDGWKFKTGDDPSWSDPSFNDSEWGSISPLKFWEQQGFPAYDGIAWYRVKIVIPSSYKKLAKKNGGFLLNLGKIDDSDFTYFNGELIGKSGEFPPASVTACNDERSYPINLKLIKWDEPNVLAIRVWDGTGNGGIYAGPPTFTIKELFGQISLSLSLKQEDHIIKGSPNISLPVTIENSSKMALKGPLSIAVYNDVGEELDTKTQEVSINQKQKAVFLFPQSRITPGFYKIMVRMESGLFAKQETFRFGYEPEKRIVAPDCQSDFVAFWNQAKADLSKVDPQYKITKIDSLCTSKRNIYLVEMHSLENARIHAWYTVPTAPGKYPVIMQVQGYSSTIIPSYVNYGDDIIGLGLNIRGHGNSKDDVNPGFPGYLLYNLDNRDKYIYRGAYMDCVRAVDFLFTRPEVDTTRIAVEGASQGGALTFATAALNNTRIKACAPQVPFLSDFPHYFKVAGWPANEFTNYVEVEKKQSWEQVYRTLSYFDIKNLATMINAPMLMGIGLCDEVCPPVINFAAYNNVKTEKSYKAYPFAGHGLPDEHYQVKMKWLREQLSLPPAQ